ncbi:PIN domain-containing protein [Micromonospora sp. CA-248212]|uniref:PIN domain-containing protein n=1 Tax=Micromonospora sp. CA-248212 TaxID=3239961 RepID=UPI003D8E2ACE
MLNGGMLVNPLPGTERTVLDSALDYLLNRLHAVVGGGGGGGTVAIERAFAYIEWVHEARRRLYNLIRPAELEQLLGLRSYETILTATSPFGGPGGERVLNSLVSTELTERVTVFEHAIRNLKERVDQLYRAGVLVVLDTNVYLHYPQELHEIDLRQDLGLREEPIYILVPMAVVDELDGKKQHQNKDTRRRARMVTAKIEQVVRNGGRLREQDYSPLGSGGIPRGEITLDVVFDPPGHTRLSITDDEIVDRAATLQTLAGRRVRLLTYDTGMAMRGRNAGLTVHKLQHSRTDDGR